MVFSYLDIKKIFLKSNTSMQDILKITDAYNMGFTYLTSPPSHYTPDISSIIGMSCITIFIKSVAFQKTCI